VDGIQRYELGKAVSFPLNGVTIGGSQRLKHQLDNTVPRWWWADLQDEEATLDDDVQVGLLEGLASGAGDHALPWPRTPAGQYPVAVVGIVGDGAPVKE
jgi:hypothetical protein